MRMSQVAVYIPFIVELFRLFTAHPEHQKLFPQFAGLSAEEMRTSKKLTAHASTAAHSLAAIVECIDDTDCLTAMLQKIADNHNKHKVPKTGFEVSQSFCVNKWHFITIKSIRYQYL